MTISDEVLRIETAMQTILDTIIGRHDRLLTTAWAGAWRSVVGDLEAGLEQLTAAGDDVQAWRIIENRRVAQGLAAAEEALDMLARDAGALFIDDATRALGLGEDGEIAMIAAQLPDDYRSVMRADAGQIAEALERTTQQITATTWPISTETSAAIRAELARGMIVGDNPREAARRMLDATEGRFTGGLSRALNISRTEMLDAMRRAQQLTDQANAASLGGWTWGAHLDSRTCISCISMHGTEWPLEEPGPLDHQSGRCARIPRTKTWAELGIVGVPEPDLGMPDAQEWFESLTDEEQASMLGPSRFAAWQRGEYPMGEWSMRRTTPEWRDSFVPSPAPRRAA